MPDNVPSFALKEAVKCAKVALPVIPLNLASGWLADINPYDPASIGLGSV